MKKIVFIFTIAMSSCSKKAEQYDLPPYSDMGAAEDAGRIQP